MECIPMNPRIQELSAGLEGVSASLSGFASSISSSIGGMKVSEPNVNSWNDELCVRVTNIMHSVNTLLEAKKSEADSISSAADLVEALKIASDDYLALYEVYKAAVEAYKNTYENATPPEDEEERKAWEAKKAEAEELCNQMKEAVLKAEEAAKSQENSVKACFSGVATSTGALAGSYDAVEVTGSELQAFCANNYIDASRVTVKKAVVDVGGANYEVYYVYDNQLEEFDQMAFNVYVNESLQNLGNLDDKELLQKVNNTYIIFEQNQGIDTGGAWAEGVQAWFRLDVNAITSWFGNRSSYDYGVAALVHEFGHATDSQVGYNEKNSHEYLSSRDIDKSLWMNLCRREGDWAGKPSANYPYLCPSYTAERFLADNGAYIAEYVAEAFAKYNYSEEARAELKKEAPDTYKAIEDMIRRAKK